MKTFVKISEKIINIILWILAIISFWGAILSYKAHTNTLPPIIQRVQAASIKESLQTTLTSNPDVHLIDNDIQKYFWARCNEEFDENFCKYADAQIQSEGGYNPHRWAEYAEGYCSWGIYMNKVCVHQGWSHDDAKYIYHSLLGHHGEKEKQRLSKHAHLLEGKWQVNKLLDLYKARIDHPQTFFRADLRHTRESAMKLFNGHKILGERLHQDIYAALALHNFNGGRNYVARVVHKKQELYN